MASLLSVLDDAESFLSGVRRVLNMDDANVQRLLAGACPQ